MSLTRKQWEELFLDAQQAEELLENLTGSPTYKQRMRVLLKRIKARVESVVGQLE